MDYSSEEASEISESEIDNYEARSYLQLKLEKHKIKNADDIYRCPFCAGKKKQDYGYKDLLQHAKGIGASNRNETVEANHRALAKHLMNDLCDTANSSLQLMVIEQEHPEPKQDELFVWPWMGILVNIPTESKNGRQIGESGKRLKVQLSKFNLLKVHPLWNFRGHTGNAAVDFRKDWTGFKDAMAFEIYFEGRHFGKKDGLERGARGPDIYGWVARADDYDALGLIAEHLRKHGDLKTVGDIATEESRKTDKLVKNVANQIEVKNKHLQELECKYNETTMSLDRMMEERDKLHQAYNEEIQKMQQLSRVHSRRIFEENEKLKTELDSKRKELNLRCQQLDKLVAQTDTEKNKLEQEKKKNAMQNSSLQLATR